MKKLLLLVLLFPALSGFAQGFFEHEIDKNFSLSIPEDSVEGETAGNPFIQGTSGDVTFVLMKVTKDHERLMAKGKTDFSKYYEGIKRGMLQNPGAEFIKEEVMTMHGQQLYYVGISALVEGTKTYVDNYIFLYKKATYMLQFSTADSKSENFTAFKKAILDSVELK